MTTFLISGGPFCPDCGHQDERHAGRCPACRCSHRKHSPGNRGATPSYGPVGTEPEGMGLLHWVWHSLTRPRGNQSPPAGSALPSSARGRVNPFHVGAAITWGIVFGDVATSPADGGTLVALFIAVALTAVGLYRS